ncbi:unnamed protein product [Closterium sp. NIES-54]
MSCPTRTVSHCPAATRAACPSALPCCSPRVAPHCCPRVAPCSPHIAPCCSLRVVPCCPPCRALLLPSALHPAARTSHPAAASASRPAALPSARPVACPTRLPYCSPRVAPCCRPRVVHHCCPRVAPCSPHVAPFCSLCVAPCSPLRRALLQPTHCASLLPSASRLHVAPCCLLPCPARASLPALARSPTAARASHSAAAHASRPARESRCPDLRPARHPALQPVRLLASAPLALPATCQRPSRAHATRTTSVPCLRSAKRAAAAKLATAATTATANPQRPPLLLQLQLLQLLLTPLSHCYWLPLPVMTTLMVATTSGGIGQQRQPAHPDTLSPQQWRQQCQQETFSPQLLCDCVSQRGIPGCAEAAALGVSQSAAALGASKFTATGPASAEALHTFTLDSRVSFVARASTILPCPAAPSDSLASLHLPSFTSNLVSNAVLQDQFVAVTTPAGELVAIGTDSHTSAHLATFTRRPGSGLYTLTTASAQVAASGPVATSSQRLCNMHSRLLVSGLLRSLPPLPRSLAPPCHPYVEGRQRAAPPSSDFPPTTAHLQTLYINVWGLAHVRGTDQERNFLLVVDHYSCYTTVFPLRSIADITERRIGLVMEVARTSIIHGVAPHFLWPFAVRYAAHQLNLWPRVSLPETSPTLRWTGEVGVVSAFWVRGALSLVRDTIASKLPSRTLRCAFLGFPTDAPSWQFFHPRSRRVLSSQDVTFDESAYYYRVYLHASHPGPAPSSVSLVDPPPLDELVEISYNSSGPAEGVDHAADDTAATLRSPRLETPPPGFPPRPSSPPPQPTAVDSGAAGGVTLVVQVLGVLSVRIWNE